jgi:polysaccharide export outer membrane protein
MIMTLRAILCLTLVLGFAATLTAQTGELPLRVGDKIVVSIGGIPDNEVAQIKGVYPINDSGTINLLHIGEVSAAGLKPSSLQRAIERTYISKEIYTRPTVSVSVDAGGTETSRPIYVVSGAQRNGRYDYRSGMTLMMAIGEAGGPTPFASMKKVKLVRTSSQGKRFASEHNLSRYSEDPSVDIVLQPGDQIILPE